jgi:aldehyde dehydrogenase (NAD+)
MVYSACSRVFVHESIAPKFIGGLKDRFEKVSSSLGADPMDSKTMFGPIADKGHFDRVMGYITQGKKDAKLITGGARKGTVGCFIEPTIFYNPDPNSAIYTEEIFGPVLVVQSFKTEEEAVSLANDTIYGLSGKSTYFDPPPPELPICYICYILTCNRASVYTSDIARALKISTAMESGNVAINSNYMSNLKAPFGGSKQSGIGRVSGEAGLMAYLESKTITIK